MLEVDALVKLGLFNQMIPMWQVFFFIAALLPFLLWNRVKLCLLRSIDLQLPKAAAPVLILLGARLGSCQAF